MKYPRFLPQYEEGFCRIGSKCKRKLLLRRVERRSNLIFKKSYDCFAVVRNDNNIMISFNSTNRESTRKKSIGITTAILPMIQ